jgi:hypothetical protein
MCIVSNVGDWGRDELPKRFPDWLPQSPADKWTPTPPSREEFDRLRKEIEELKAMLKKAKELDKAMGLPDCQMESKIEFLRKCAELVGVDLDEVFGPKK